MTTPPNPDIMDTQSVIIDELRAIRGEQTVIKTALLGDLNTERPGLIHRVSHLERQHAIQNKISMAFLTALIGAVVVAVFQLIRTLPP